MRHLWSYMKRIAFFYTCIFYVERVEFPKYLSAIYLSIDAAMHYYNEEKFEGRPLINFIL